MCQNAMDASLRTEEQRLVLEVLKLHPSKAALDMANKAKQTPQLEDEANATVQAIAKEPGK